MRWFRQSSAALVAVVLAAALLLGGCGDDDDGPDETTTVVTDDTGAGLANPASVFCEEQGGTIEIETGEDGGQRGICVLPDGTRVDEWDYYHENNPDVAPED